MPMESRETSERLRCAPLPDSKQYLYSQVPQQDNGGIASQEVDCDEGEDIELNDDVYAAFMYTVVFDIRELFGGDHDDLMAIVNIFRFLFIILLLLTNFALQFCLIYYIYFYVAAPAVHKVQTLYQKYHSEVYHDGQFDMDLWVGADEDFQSDLCNMVYSNYWFIYAILFIWWMTMAKELRNNERMARQLWNIRSTHSLELMIVQGEDGINRVKGLVCVVRCLLFTVMWIPKMVISISLLVLGTMWLVATDFFADLVLNAVALEFVIQLDELVYDSMVPQPVKKDIRNAVLWFPKKKASNATSQRAQEVTSGLLRSFVWYSFIAAGAYGYLSYGQTIPFIGIFPQYANDMKCQDFWVRRASPVCRAGEPCFEIDG